jgi:hypothetical protein
MSLVAQKIGQIFRNSIKKSIIYFQWFRSFFNEALQPQFLAEKMTGQKQ